MKKLLPPLFLLLALNLTAQTVSIKTGWKFKTGDDPSWADPGLDDRQWAPISVGAYWESQGYANYDGFAWYRLHVIIPSPLKNSAFFNQNLIFDLGKVDDEDEFFLNGSLIGKNGETHSTSGKMSFSKPRKYVLPLTDPNIHWDQENVLAVRVYDKEMEGGMYEGDYIIRPTGLPDFVRMQTRDSLAGSGNDLSVFRKIKLHTSGTPFSFIGTLKITEADPSSKRILYERDLPAAFSQGKPFECSWPVPPAKNGSWLFTYVFEEASSRKKMTMTEQEPFVPADKHLDSSRVAALFKKGTQKIYRARELDHIAMPCGGIGAGQIEITGDGTLCPTTSIYNRLLPPNAGLGFSTGDQYLNPQPASPKFSSGFAVSIREKGKPDRCLRLNRGDFDSLGFVGEYPIATIYYHKSGAALPVDISAEFFSPFVPLSLRSSANPVTVQKFSITNHSRSTVTISIAAFLQSDSSSRSDSHDLNQVVRSAGLTSVLLGTDEALAKHAGYAGINGCPRGNGDPQYGDLTLSVLDGKAFASADCASAGASFEHLKSGGRMASPENRIASMKTGGGEIHSTIALAPGETKTISFLITWYFPNLYESSFGRTGFAGHLYNTWYQSSWDAARWIAENFAQLYGQTKLFHDTYFDNTLPYWLSNRISMPLSTMACDNIQIWESGRMYGYEGIGFCPGSTGHVYNFVPSVSKLFPMLERSERIMQDLNDSMGFNPSGRINFRGHDGASPGAENAYASDAQCGYVLKLYREHLMSPNRKFLDSVWDKAKRVIGYMIFRDGGAIGMEPNGVLEDLQTFWDPMWYGPNPYNGSLYLAALRAAEEMARIEGEVALANRYHNIFEKGRAFMSTQMWNGQYFIHLYPNGFSGTLAMSGLASPEDLDENAKGFTKAFDEGAPNYFASSSCDAQQLFGQNWANQLGLGYILPEEECRTAAQHIFLYNWTPDIATVYNARKPLNRILAASGEAAMVNGSWPFAKPLNFENPVTMYDYNFERTFENIWDKSDVWCGLEYEAACDMINEGLLREALILVHAIDDRYNGTKRNPWNEIEGSDHYVRSMQSWNLLLSLGGFEYDGPAGKLGFSPRFSPNHFKSFFSAAEGWGSCSQDLKDGLQREAIHVKWGQLRLARMSFTPLINTPTPAVQVSIDGKAIASKQELVEGKMQIYLDREQTLKAGQILEVLIRN